jgi:hypothetical protein
LEEEIFMRNTTWLLIPSLASLALGGAIVACSSSSASSSSPVDASTKSDAPVTTSDGGAPDGANVAACTASANAVCALEAKCDPNTPVGQYGDAGACVTRQQLSCLANLTAPATGATAAHTTSCATAESTESCTDYLDLNPPAACATAVGSAATGSACSHNSQCATGFCGIDPASVCGTCQTPPAAGASCAALTSCGQTLACVKGTCVAYVTASGSACSATQPCGTGLSCVIAKNAAAGTCLAAGAMAGVACDPTTETAAGCDVSKGLSCVGSAGGANAKTCQPIVIAQPGSPCGRISGVETTCAGATCTSNGPDAGYSCVARAADNAACNSATGPACEPPARCIGTDIDGGVSGTCTPPSNAACP